MIFYRSDIDGLRAIAVTSVVLFHAGFKVFSGGFTGVDIFFVISGFLITSLILKEIEAATFSLSGFYERRIRRLAPALFPVLLFVYISSLFLFSPNDFKIFSQSLISFMAFVSNWLFLSQTGYFDIGSEAKPLLHTWSLSIEEQFYLFMPFTLLTLSWINKKLINIFLISLLIFSLIINLYWVNREQLDIAFFNSIGRFWELLSGSLLATGSFRKIENILTIKIMRLVGFILVLIPIFAYDYSTPFPGLAAVIPTFGAALIIYASPHTNDPVTKILSWFPIVYIGRISYSWYLWHWPIFVFMRTYYPNANALHSIMAIIASFILAVLSYHIIEIPIRHKYVLPQKEQMYQLFGTMLLVFMIAGPLGYFTDGLPQRFPRDNLQLTNSLPPRDSQNNCIQDKNWEVSSINKLVNNQVCNLGVLDRNHYDFIVIGDSHAYVLRQAFNAIANRQGLKGALAVYNACPPLINVNVVRRPDSRCDLFNIEAHKFIKRHEIQTVFLVSNWAVYLYGYFPNKNTGGPYLIREGFNSQGADRFKIFAKAVPETIESLLGRKIYVLGSVPSQPHRVPETLSLEKRIGRSQNNLWTTRDQYLEWQTPVLAIWKEQALLGRVTFIDPTEHFCASGTCLVQLDSFALYTDSNHLSPQGVLFIQPLLEPALTAIGR